MGSEMCIRDRFGSDETVSAAAIVCPYLHRLRRNDCESTELLQTTNSLINGGELEA